jgi:hypothetical protein
MLVDLMVLPHVLGGTLIKSLTGIFSEFQFTSDIHNNHNSDDKNANYGKYRLPNLFGTFVTIDQVLLLCLD